MTHSGNTSDSEQSTEAPTRPKGKSGLSRSRKGCWTCRQKKVKCDEHRPECFRCRRLWLRCDYSVRPKLSERRRLQRQREATASITLLQTDPVSERASQSTACDFDQVVDLYGLAPRVTGQCSLPLYSIELHAICFFRTSFSDFFHSKTAKYSMYSIMCQVAKRDHMVMHMILALGLREVSIRRPHVDKTEMEFSTRHYSATLRLLNKEVRSPERLHDLDALYTVLYLMLTYEEKFGDKQCNGFYSHLAGASTILKHCGRHKLYPLEFSPAGMASQEQEVSFYAARLLTWISFSDSAAATWGHGGLFNSTLHESLNHEMRSTDIPDSAALSTFEDIERLERYSGPLYREFWGESYPQTELVDDVENRNIFVLLTRCGQLRLIISRLASLWETNPTLAMERAPIILSLVDQVGYSSGDLLEVATHLSAHTDNSRRLVENIRNIVPFYYAAVLQLLRLTRFDKHLGHRQRQAVREIMNLAFQGYKHDGDQAVMRISWPLFLVALETDDLVYRDWVLRRFADVAKYGQNIERAHRFLIEIISKQDFLGRRIDFRQVMRSKRFDCFVLSR